jgi:beta-glucosidase
MKRFPDNFDWGAATSAFQIEGAIHEDGRGESIWDRFASHPGKIADGSDGRVACDHYNRWEKDIELLKWLGVSSYRFSIGWARVVPDGFGKINQRGLDFYERLIDGLLAAGIQPFPTLNHWDMPQALQDAGGWPSRETVGAFVDYTEAVIKRLGDRLQRIGTHNEPWCISVLGYANGEHAPGEKHWGRALAASHHLLLSHGLAVKAIRALAPRLETGMVVNLTPGEPASDSEADREATREFDGMFNRWFLDPLFGKGYPADVIADHVKARRIASDKLPFLQAGDLEAMAAPSDFLGINYYSRAVLRSNAIPETENAPRKIIPSDEKTDMGWEVAPAGLLAILRRVHKDYRPRRMYVTENGAAYSTTPDEDGRIRDVERVRYLWTHFDAAHQAISEGIPLEGYYIWSLLDNFEWAQGYTKRFGLFWVDYTTQERMPKDSAHLCRQIIRDNALQGEVAP